MSHLQTLLDRRATAWTAMQEIMTRAETENRELTAEERQAWDRGEGDVKNLSEDIDRLQRAANLTDVDRRSIVGAGDPDSRDDRTGEQQAAQYRQAFEGYLRQGMGRLNAEHRALLEAEYRDQSVGTTTAGGFTVPQDFLTKITETLKAYGGLFQVANVITTSDGRILPWPTNDDTGNVGAIITENTADTTLDVTFGQKQLTAYTYTSKAIKISLELLQDTAFDLEAFVTRKIGQRIGRALAAHLATGTGTNQPTGVTTGITAGKTGLTGQTTSVIYDDLVDLLHSIDAAYRNGMNCRWAMADLSLAVVRKLKDTQGHPLWQPAVTAGVPDTLLGYPVSIDNGLPVMAANATPILFGDFYAGYIVRQVLGIQVERLAERWADQRQVGFFGFARFDAKPDDTAAVKAYKNSAT